MQCKSYSHFFSKKYQNIVSAKPVNEMTLNELVKLTMLWTTGPWPWGSTSNVICFSGDIENKYQYCLDWKKQNKNTELELWKFHKHHPYLFQKCEYGDPEEVLGMALDPPQSQTVTRAMALLHSVGACTGGKLTPLGHHLATLPVHVRIGKMLLYGAVFDCLEPVVRFVINLLMISLLNS